MTAAVQRGGREHRADMAGRGGAAEHLEREPVVPRAPASRDQHLAIQRLGVRHAALGGARDPALPFGRVGIEAAPLDQHPSVPVLGVDDSVGGAAEPEQGTPVVALDADAFGEADAEIERADQVAGARRTLEGGAGQHLVAVGAGAAADHEIGEIEHAGRIAALGGPTEPARRLVRVAADAGAGQRQEAERAARRGVAARGGATVPERRLGVVRRQFAAARIEVADQGGGFRVAAERRPPEPALALGEVARQAVPLHQREAETGLRGAVAALGRATIQAHRLGRVAFDAGAAIVHHAEQIQRGRQSGVGGGAKLGRAFGQRLGARLAAEQRQRVAETPARVARARRALVGGIAGVEVAHRLGSGGQDVADQRLRLGRPARGRASRPAQGRRVIDVAGGRAAIGAEQRLASVLGRNVAAQVECRQRGLRVGPARLRRALEPARPLRPARRHAGPGEIRAPDPVGGLRNAGGGCGRQMREGLGGLAGLDQPDGAREAPVGACSEREAIEKTHRRQGSRIPSRIAGTTELSRYCMIVRCPTLMSAETGMPGVRRKPFGTSCSVLWSIAIRTR